jgi:hypothetical protein
VALQPVELGAERLVTRHPVPDIITLIA